MACIVHCRRRIMSGRVPTLSPAVQALVGQTVRRHLVMSPVNFNGPLHCDLGKREQLQINSCHVVCHVSTATGAIVVITVVRQGSICRST